MNLSNFRIKTTLACLAILAGTVIPSKAMSAAPGAQFNGKVSEIFINNGSILIAVTGNVNGACGGTFGSYNLTFDFTDPGAQFKFELIKSAFIEGKRISGYVQNCGSSNINKLIQVSSF